MGKLHLVLVVMILFGFNNPCISKSLGNFKNYRQVTDKEVLIESTKGAFILISAYNDYALQIATLSNSEAVALIPPAKIHLQDYLNGSIYVEELDEMMQITTTISDGVVIKINKNPLRFSFIDKTTNEVLVEELKGVNFGKNTNDILFSVGLNEEIKLITGNLFQTNSTAIQTGEIYSNEAINQLIFPENDICLVSSKGYSMVFKSNKTHHIDFSKSDKIRISNHYIESRQFNYLLIFGAQQPEMIERYALNVNEKEKQITLN